MTKHPKTTNQQRYEIRAALALAVRKGRPIHQAAKDYGVGTSTAYNACKEHGVVIGGIEQRTLRGATYEILAELLNTHDTLEEIGERAKKSPQRVWQILDRARTAGIKFDNRPNRQGNPKP